MAEKKLFSTETVDTINGKAFRKERKSLGLTLRDIAEGCGLSVAYICDVELGRRVARGRSATAMIEALKK